MLFRGRTLMGDVGVAATLNTGSFGGELNEALVNMASRENVICSRQVRAIFFKFYCAMEEGS